MKYKYIHPSDKIVLNEAPVCPYCGADHPYLNAVVEKHYIDYKEESGEPIEITVQTQKYLCRKCERIWSEIENLPRTSFTWNLLWHLLNEYSKGASTNKLSKKFFTGKTSIPRLLRRYGTELDKTGDRTLPKTVMAVPIEINNMEIVALADPNTFRLLDLFERDSIPEDLSGKTVMLPGDLELFYAISKAGAEARVMPLSTLKHALKEDMNEAGIPPADYFDDKNLDLRIFENMNFIRFIPVIGALKEKNLEAFRPVPGIENYNEALSFIRSLPEKALIIDEEPYAELAEAVGKFSEDTAKRHKGKLSYFLFRTLLLYAGNPIAQALPVAIRKNPYFRFFRQLSKETQK